MDNDVDYGLSKFFGFFSFALFCIAIFHLIFFDTVLTLWLIVAEFVVCAFFGIINSNPNHIIKSWDVVIVTVNNSTFYLGRNLSWDDAKLLRDDTVKKFESNDLMLSVRCTNSGTRYGVRNFVKSNIVHIGWLEE